MNRILLLSLSFGLVATTAHGTGPLRTGPTAGGAWDPADFAPPVVSYASAFAGYRPFGDQTVNDWRASNDTVGRIGGWQAYVRESQQAAQPPSAGTQKPGSLSPASGHDAHHR